MPRKLSRQNSRISQGALVTHVNASEMQEQKKAALDCFEVKVSPTGLNTQLFNKIDKAMRSAVVVLPQEVNNEMQLGQRFSLADIKKLRSLSDTQATFAYLEGIYVAGRYCALVDPSDQGIQRNAQAVMARYLKELKHPSQDKLYWIKKDYGAGTAGEDVVSDAKLLEQAKPFSRRLLRIDKDESLGSGQKKISHVIKHDSNPLAAFIALRRALFAAQ